MKRLLSRLSRAFGYDLVRRGQHEQFTPSAEPVRPANNWSITTTSLIRPTGDWSTNSKVLPVRLGDALPRPSDCLDGRCWWWNPYDEYWYLARYNPDRLTVDGIKPCPAFAYMLWLPYYAIHFPG